MTDTRRRLYLALFLVSVSLVALHGLVGSFLGMAMGFVTAIVWFTLYLMYGGVADG